MTETNNALRLADELEIPIEGYPEATELERNAAAELRRLHAYCQELESQVIRDCMTHVQNPAENEHVAGDLSKNSAKKNMNVYAELPQSVGDHKYGGGLYTDAQMRAFADATHTLRIASHGQAPAQPTVAQAAESVPAVDGSLEVADAMADSQYLAGVSAGWNAANADDPNAALQKLHASRAGYLKPLATVHTSVDSVLEDTARYRWLFGARTEAQAACVSETVFKPLPQDEVLSHLQGFYMSKTDVDALVDAARKQGGAT